MIQLPVSSAELAEAAGENSDIGSFANYLKIQTGHQHDVLNKISPRMTAVQKIPLIFEDQAWPLVEKIAGALS
jgi:hypothetical protein